MLALLAIGVGAIGVTHLGLYPIGADNPPGAIEHALASRAMDVYAEKHKPEGANPTEITPANLTEGATAGFRVTVTCSESSHVEGTSPVRVYVFDVRAEAGAYGGPDYVSRRLQTKIVDAA